MANECSRRTALKTVGAGIALIATGLGLSAAEAETKSATPGKKAEPAPQPFVLPALGYDFDALEPHIDARTMEIHYTKHHQAYIDNANRVLAELPELQKLKAEDLLKDLSVAPENVRVTLRNHLGGHVNHCLFWRGLSPRPQVLPARELASALEKTFGSFDAFKERLTEAAMKRFGSGWAWLSLRKEGGLAIHSTPNQDSPIMEGFIPLVGIDVWEHAYYLNYQNRRLDYVNAVLRVTDWRVVDELYAGALAAQKKA